MIDPQVGIKVKLDSLKWGVIVRVKPEVVEVQMAGGVRKKVKTSELHRLSIGDEPKAKTPMVPKSPHPKIKAPIMDVVAFGGQLIESLDLDPIYVMLYNAKLDKSLLKRWMLAYWCFYHAGVSSKIAEASDWHAESRKAHDEKWPRGRERRHFRGEASDTALKFLKEKYPQPEAAVDFLCKSKTFARVRERVDTWPMFGPWIAYKCADMLDRVLEHPIKFSKKDLGFYKEPAEAAKMIDPSQTLEQVVELLLGVYSGMKAPPAFDRPIGVNECETVMCKWKAHHNGHYWIGEDIWAIRQGLRGWGPLAERLEKTLPKDVPQ